MGMNDTPSAQRIHIGFFGRRNAGKSSIVNAVTGQNLAVVSEIPGTTTDPVYKAMELLPLGPVVVIDTPGYDDVGELGELRIQKTKQVLNKTDIAILVVDAQSGIRQSEQQMIQLFQQKQISYLVVFNKEDLQAEHPQPGEREIYVSARNGSGIHQLKEMIAHLQPTGEADRPLVKDLLQPGQTAVLVVPIDSSAPKGRLILPQQQVIRDVLEAHATALVCQDGQLKQAIQGLRERPAMVITDSQVFSQAAADTPADVPLTSFSILMARYKGILQQSVQGVAAIEHLQDGDTVLISEGCTHHRQCQDIGTVKIPHWLKEHTGKDLKIVTSSGTEFPEDLSPYRVIIHCGGCMLNAREMEYRMKCALDQKVPMTNYGVTIAQMKGILKRSLQLFPDLAALLP